VKSTPDQEEALSRMTTFLETLTEELGDQTPDMKEIDAATPTGAAKRVAETVIKAERE
jgi:hypothetical protein